MKIGLCFLVLCARPMLPQVPQFTAAGVVNAFSYAQPVSPGSLVSLFGTDLATAAASATSIPLPLKLGGTSVTVNGVNAPLLFVSPRQINFQLPSVVGTQDSAYVTTASVVITTPAGSSEAVEAPVFASGPAIATSTQNGCGQAAALNVARDGTVSLNSPTNSAARGDYISLYGTGLGVSIAQPPDGTALPYGLGVEFEPGVWLDGYIATVVPFAGLAPDLVGVDQVNVQIPQYVREGCAVPVAIEAGALISPLATGTAHPSLTY